MGCGGSSKKESKSSKCKYSLPFNQNTYIYIQISNNI